MQISKAASLVRLARQAIVSELQDKEIDYDNSGEKQGVFVTLLKNGELRGCIGFPQPIFPIEEAVVKAARAAAFRDPRFLPVSDQELREICIELSIMTRSKKIENMEEIIVGQTGIMVSKNNDSGLLLPQVAVEHKWTRDEFLDNACLKAGLERHAWEDADVSIFECQVFQEKTPGGKVESKL